MQGKLPLEFKRRKLADHLEQLISSAGWSKSSAHAAAADDHGGAELQAPAPASAAAAAEAGGEPAAALAPLDGVPQSHTDLSHTGSLHLLPASMPPPALTYSSLHFLTGSSRPSLSLMANFSQLPSVPAPTWHQHQQQHTQQSAQHQQRTAQASADCATDALPAAIDAIPLTETYQQCRARVARLFWQHARVGRQ